MNLKASLGEITVTFTPDELEQVKRLLDFTVQSVEDINRRDFEELAGLREPSPKWWEHSQ